MAGKGLLTKTECGTFIFRLIMDGKVIDRIEIDSLFLVGKDADIESDEERIVKAVWNGEYDAVKEK